MGNPPYADVFKFASDALDTRRVRHHVHESVSFSFTTLQQTNASSASLNDQCLLAVCLPRVFSAFFRKGQVIETFRGEGIYQPAVDLAIEKLRAGAWVRYASRSFRFTPPTRTDEPNRIAKKKNLFVQIHLFGEGKVCQSDTYKADPQTGIARLQRFRWGMCVILNFKFFYDFAQQSLNFNSSLNIFFARLQWPYFDGDAPPADNYSYVDHRYV